ncbi:MAG: hypothetical protein WD272_05665 [Balneolales bacterium]
MLLVGIANSISSRKNIPLKLNNNFGSIEGWYADPEGIIFNNEYWILPTYSDHYGEPDTSSVFTERQLEARSQAINEQYLIQTFFDVFSSNDLVNWEIHSQNIIWSTIAVHWIRITPTTGL